MDGLQKFIEQKLLEKGIVLFEPGNTIEVERIEVPANTELKFDYTNEYLYIYDVSVSSGTFPMDEFVIKSAARIVDNLILANGVPLAPAEITGNVIIKNKSTADDMVFAFYRVILNNITQ